MGVPEADGILVLEHTFLRSPGACSGSDLTEPTRQRRTFDTAAILSVGLNDSLNGADVSHAPRGVMRFLASLVA